MCNANLIMGAQGFGAGMSAVGAFMGAQQQRDQLRHQANIADINARIAEGNARNIIYAGTVEESRAKMEGAQRKGATIARLASSGVDIAGSPTAIARLTGTDLITEVDANTIRTNALRAAWGQRFAAGDQRRAAASYRASASSISPLMSGATSLINSAGTPSRGIPGTYPALIGTPGGMRSSRNGHSSPAPMTPTRRENRSSSVICASTSRARASGSPGSLTAHPLWRTRRAARARVPAPSPAPPTRRSSRLLSR